MTYLLNYNGKNYQLEQYKANTAIVFNNAYKVAVDENADMLERIKACVAGIGVALTVPVAEKLFDDFTDVDINDLMILLENIKQVYTKPLAEYKAKRVVNAITEAIDKSKLSLKDDNNTEKAEQNEEQRTEAVT